MPRAGHQVCMHSWKGSRQVPAEQGAGLRQGAPCRVLHIRKPGDSGLNCRQGEEDVIQVHCCTSKMIRISCFQQEAAPASMVMMRSKVGASGRPWPASSGLCNVMLGFASALSILLCGQTYHISSFLVPRFWSSRYTRLSKPGRHKPVVLHYYVVLTGVACWHRARSAACLSCAAASDLAEMS